MSLRDYILSNLWLKSVSLALAGLIWFAIHFNVQRGARLQQNLLRAVATRDFRRPITVLTSATNRRLFAIEPTEVNVRVRGDTTVLQNLNPEDIQVFVKLIDVPDPQGSFFLEVNVPRDIVLQQVRPAHVYVRPVIPSAN